ncbi:hypothetical protein [Aneurinibacillus terranovensis]|uniref:hypothetical protein n=1 Tax=Aneurinibacillus terranovensis TaxID=278991 RepID=UPI00041B0181
MMDQIAKSISSLTNEEKIKATQTSQVGIRHALRGLLWKWESTSLLCKTYATVQQAIEATYTGKTKGAFYE